MVPVLELHHQPSGQMGTWPLELLQSWEGRLWEPASQSTFSYRKCLGPRDGAGTVTEHPMARKLISLSLLVCFLESDVSPTPPITVTHKPEEDTFGVSHFWSKSMFTGIVIFRLHLSC